MSFSTDLQDLSSHRALINLQDFEINFFEDIKKFCSSRIKLDLEYAKNLAVLTGNFEKTDCSEICSPLKKVWLGALQKLTLLSDAISQNCMKLNGSCLSRLDSLIAEKKVTRKLYVDQRNKLESDLNKFQEEIKKNSINYEKLIQKMNNNQLKINQLEDKGQSGSSKVGETMSRMEGLKTKLFSSHNLYILALEESNLFKKHYSCVLLPNLLDEQQIIMEASIKHCQAVLQEFFSSTNYSSNTFQDLHNDILKLISTIKPTMEYTDFVAKFRSDPIKFEKQEYTSLLTYGSDDAHLIIDEFITDELVKIQHGIVNNLAKSRESLTTKRKELEDLGGHHETSTCGFVSEDDAVIMKTLRREIFELQCSEKRYETLSNTITEALKNPQKHKLCQISTSFNEEDSVDATNDQSQPASKRPMSGSNKSLSSQIFMRFARPKSLGRTKKRNRKSEASDSVKEEGGGEDKMSECKKTVLSGYEDQQEIKSKRRVHNPRRHSVYDSTTAFAVQDELDAQRFVEEGGENEDESIANLENTKRALAHQHFLIDKNMARASHLSKKVKSSGDVRLIKTESESVFQETAFPAGSFKGDAGKVIKEKVKNRTYSEKSKSSKKDKRLTSSVVYNDSTPESVEGVSFALRLVTVDTKTIRHSSSAEDIRYSRGNDDDDDNGGEGDESQNDSAIIKSLRARVALKPPPPLPPLKIDTQCEKHLESEEWFHGLLPRDEVQSLLVREGEFLVRTTRNKNVSTSSLSQSLNKEQQFVLSVFSSQNHKHFIIQESEEGYHFEDDIYPTVQDLIYSYVSSGQPITQKSNAVIKIPVPKCNWELVNSDIQLLEKIGSGQFGEVYRGVLTLKTSLSPLASHLNQTPDSSKQSALVKKALFTKPTVPPKPALSSSASTPLLQPSLAGPSSLVQSTSPVSTTPPPSTPSTSKPIVGKMIVAVKICKDSLNEENRMRFLKEARLLKLYNHPNIVKFVGVATLTMPVMIVMEYVAGGSLLSFVRKHTELTSSCLIKMSLDIAAGMTYLESKNCIHRDLAARNCLVSVNGNGDVIDVNDFSNVTIKISDFGMSKMEEEYTIIAGTRQIPIKWTAPEALSFGKYTIASDVWSFGIVVWELFSFGCVPYQGMSNSLATEMIEKGHRLAATDNMPPKLYNLLLTCWNKNPEDRMTFSEILINLQDVFDYLM